VKSGDSWAWSRPLDGFHPPRVPAGIKCCRRLTEHSMSPSSDVPCAFHISADQNAVSAWESSSETLSSHRDCCNTERTGRRTSRTTAIYIRESHSSVRVRERIRRSRMRCHSPCCRRGALCFPRAGTISGDRPMLYGMYRWTSLSQSFSSS
jgi:hypothetical protein